MPEGSEKSRPPQSSSPSADHVGTGARYTCKESVWLLFCFFSFFIFLIQFLLLHFPSSSQSRKNVGQKELEIETQVAQLMGRAYTKPPDPSLTELSESGEEDKTYLLFTTGSLTYSPHQIGNKVIQQRCDIFSKLCQPSLTWKLLFHFPGIKRIRPEQMTTSGPVLGEERSSDEFFDSLDHVIDIHGHIIGMGLSPDHR